MSSLNRRQQRRIQQHIQELDSADKDVSERAEGYLIRYYGAKALDSLLQVCQHPNPIVRYRAVWILGHTKDERAYEAILRLTDDPNEEVRYDATLALGILGDKRAVEPLKAIALLNDYTRPAVNALEKLGVEVAMAACQELLERGEPPVRWSAIQLLGNLAENGDRDCLNLIKAYRNDPSEMVRENVEFWLKEIRDTKSQSTNTV